ncbi:MAG: Fur family transcriptional regulator [Planctomycetota bacterium]|jgi:Fur family peroxide stress response transcriptional regulator
MVDELKEKIDACEARCRAAGLKVTPQRLAVFKALLEMGQHPSAEAVFRKVKQVFPSISLDTVNRTLLTLSEIGLAAVVEGSGDAKRFDGNLETHQHFKCVRCKRIVDFYHSPFENVKVPAGIGKKFTVLRKTVYIEGICDVCSQKRCQ